MDNNKKLIVEQNSDDNTNDNTWTMMWTGKLNEPLVEDNIYLVCRKNMDNDPTYLLCIYSNGCWVPYGLENITKTMFTGIPIIDEDRWVCVNTMFENILTSPVDSEKSASIKNEGVHEFMIRRIAEMCDDMKDNHTNKNNNMIQSWEGPLNIYRIIDIMLEYIDKLDKKTIPDHILEKNWEHLKNFTNKLCDRICELERKINNITIINDLQKSPSPYIPTDPSPVSPYPSTPSIPTPYSPIITYSCGKGKYEINTNTTNESTTEHK